MAVAISVAHFMKEPSLCMAERCSSRLSFFFGLFLSLLCVLPLTRMSVVFHGQAGWNCVVTGEGNCTHVLVSDSAGDVNW